MTEGTFLTVKDCESRDVYHSPNRLGYACWVSFFPGEEGKWYITFEEVSYPDKPLPKMSKEQWYAFSLPLGYDKSEYKMELVIAESTDGMKTWNVISREPCRFQHTAGSFGQAKTKDGRFIRFVWACYCLDGETAPNEIMFVSSDNGKTWEKQPALFDDRFGCYPHRLRTLRDGTLVLAVPICPAFSADRPRATKNLNAVSEWQICMLCSYDQGRTWSEPLPVLNGQEVTETDFVELGSGDLLFISSSMWAHPGRQVIYRTKKGFIPGPYELATSYDFVPETVCITEDETLVGCYRFPGKGNIQYAFSDDLGFTWYPIKGITEKLGCLYQPWIHYLGGGRFACAGHIGLDESIKDRGGDQYVALHTFTLEKPAGTKNTDLRLHRDYDEDKRKYINEYTLTLTCGGEPAKGKEIEFWYVERDKPGYDSYNKNTITERMKMGGNLVRVKTDDRGEAHIKLAEFDQVEYIHHCIQIVARFNMDRKYADLKPFQTVQYSFYSVGDQDPPLQL